MGMRLTPSQSASVLRRGTRGEYLYEVAKFSIEDNYSYYCGYVRVPNTWHIPFDDFVQVADPAGGVSYADKEDGVIGFDFDHAGFSCIDPDSGERMNGMPVRSLASSMTTEWTLDDVRDECIRLCDRLREYEQSIDPQLSFY